MLGTHALGLFALTTLVVNATPGVDLALTLTKTLQQGMRGGLAAAAGIAAGCVLHTLAAAFGLAALVAASAEAFAVLKIVGALYLAWLAIGMWRQALARASEGAPAAPPPTRAAGEAAVASPAALRRTFAQALATNVLNPKIALFFLALLPQFIDAAAPSKTLAFLVLGGWFVVQGFVFLAAFAWLVAPLRRRATSPRLGRAANALGGTLFAGLALRLAVAER